MDMDEDGYRANYIEVKLCEVDKYYDIFEEIGKGRFGVVHRCVEKATGKTWAAKCVRALRRKDRDEIKREVELMSILEHPMLLQCGGAFEGRSSMTIILEHVSGGELFERIISDDFEFCESDAVIFMRQICLGVQHMHKLNIVHLDLKPENIMCMDKRSNRIKIIDFGLSRKLKPGEAMKVMFGTPEFIAPEVINYDPIETLTDMWSVGVICYILLSGFSPFLGDLDTDTLNNVTRAEWDFDDPAFDTISEDAKAFIEALLIRLPRKRNCAEECLRHGWLAGDTRPKETTRLSTEKLKRYVAKRRWQKTAIALRAIHRMNVLTMFGGKSESNSAGKSTTLEKPDELSSTEEQKPSTKRVSRLRRRNSIVDEVRQKFEPNNNDPSIGIDVFKETMFTKDKTRTIMAEKTQTFTKYQMPSAILDTLKDQCVCKGDTVKFICKINGNPRPEVCWFKNGDVIDENNHFKFEFDDICRYSLIINHVTEDDFGRYSIKASNTLGECESSANLYKKELSEDIRKEFSEESQSSSQKHSPDKQKSFCNLTRDFTKEPVIPKSEQSSYCDVTDRAAPPSVSKTPPSILISRNLVPSSTIKALVSRWKETAKSRSSTRPVVSLCARTPGKLSTNIVKRFSNTEIQGANTVDSGITEKKQVNEEENNSHKEQHTPEDLRNTSNISPLVIPKRSIPVRHTYSAPTASRKTINKEQTKPQTSRNKNSSIKSPSKRVPFGQVGVISSKLEAKPNKEASANTFQRKIIKTNKDISEISKRFSLTVPENRSKIPGHLKPKEHVNTSKSKDINKPKPTRPRSEIVKTKTEKLSPKRRGSNQSSTGLIKPTQNGASFKEISKNKEAEPSLKKKKEPRLSLKEPPGPTTTENNHKSRVPVSPRSSLAYAKQKLQEPKKMSVRKTVELSPGRTKGIGALAAKFETKNKIETSTTTKSIKAEPSFASRFQKVNDNITTNGKAKDVGNFNHSPVKKPTKPPAFGLKPKRESCRAGGKASFHCTAFGMSKPDVTWSFNGTALENSKRHKIHIDKGIYYLEIIDLVLEDAGTYICKMENAAGSVESPVELTVRDNQKRFQNGLTPTSSPVPNLNSKSPSVSSSTKLNAFQKFNDLCKTNGSPSSNRVNKSPIEVSTKREKTSTTIKLSSTVKQNDEPKKLQTKTLKFELKRGQQSVKPKSDDIVDSPVTPKTITKTNVTKDEASPKQTSLMPSSTDTTESTSIKRTSLLTPTKFSTDSDVASPKRTSYSNPTSTTKVPVVVEWTPPAMTNKSSEVGESNSPNQTSITTTSKVKAVAEPTSPKRTVSSTSKTTVTLSTGVEQTSPKRTLPTTDSNVPMSVEATTPTRTLIPKTQKVTLKVQQPPQFTSRPKSQTTKESKLAKFTCTITGDPIPEVKWMKDGQAIPEETRIQILENETEHSIEISDVIQSDAGRYSCVLSNPAGKTTASCQLSVQANPTTLPKVEHQFPPTFLRKLSDLKCKDAESVSFECRVSGTPKPNVSWFFEGKPITHDNVYQISFDEPVAKLTIAEVFPEDGGNYTCTLAYPAGTISSTARLEVEEANDINGSETNGPMSNSIDLAIIPEKTSTPVKSTSAKIVTKPLSPIVMTTAPEFLKKLTDVTVDDGSSLTLKVEVKGSPAPTALWFFKDEEIIEEEDFKFVSDGNTLSLVIAEVYPEDAGMYTCVITNSEGKASTSCKVLVDESGDVGIPPSFMQKPHQMNIDEGTIITLTCKVDGDPEPNVFWYKESRIIKPSDRVQLVSKGFSHSLRIPAAIVTDTGSYTCIAKNEVGEEKCTVSVMVHQIEEEHTDFRSLLKSRPKLQKMDNINQNEEENEAGQLDFRHVLNKSKSEEEELQAATDAAIKESEAEQLDFRHLLTRHVQTKQHPKFTNELSDAMVDEGSSAVLVCSVVGTPVPTIIWKFKGKEIKESKYFRMKYEDNVAQLSISETFAEDEGEYVCLATNSAGTAKSVADLRVKACDEDELDNSTDNIVTTKPNEDVDSTFHSPISAKLNTPVANAVGHKVASFTMNATAKPFGDSSSKMPDVSPPEFLEELCDEPIIEGSAARLECRLIGDPEPVVYWYKDGKELKEGRKYSFEFDDDDIVALVIKETTMRDLGKYACKAVNSLGTVECSAQLIIEAPPKIEKYPRNLITCAGKDICITCKISGTPEPDLEWYRGKKEITEGGRIEMEDVDDDTMLYIRDAKQDDSGIYKLVLTSDLGTDSCTISVSVVDKPDPPSGKPVSSNVSRTSLTLSWSGSPYDGGSIITGYVVEMSKVNEDNWTKLTTAKSTSYVVRGLVPEKMYCFRIRSENAYGVSDPGMTSDPVRTTETKVQKESKADSGDEGECPFEARHVVIKSEDIKNSYDIQEQVGKGRFGIVHKCMEKATGKMWAAKFIKTKASEKESVKAEIEIMNQLQHPKLIQCVDAFETTREIIMVLEFVRGGELFERVIDDDFVLTEKDVIMFMRQICSGVKHMHSQNILHLDLKPENILCTDTTGNSIKLIDFGLARKFDPKQSVKVMFGTPEFVAPEVVNYEKIGYKTDMWSVGVICYILLSGLSPFMGDNDAETLSAVTMAEWDFEDESFDEISDEAKDFIEKLLLKSKDTRMSASDGLEHMWLTKDTKTMKTTKISTDKLKKFVARRRWQKTANAVRAISRMASLSMFSVRNRSLSQDDGTSGGLTPFSSILKAKREEAKNVNNITKTKEPEVDINLNETGTTKLSNRRNRKFTEEKRSSIDSDESPIKKRSSSDGSVKKLSTDSFSRFGSKSSLPSPNIEMKTESSSRASGEQKIWPPSGQRATRDAVINKEAKPKFLKKIRSTTVLEGQKAQFNCIVIGDPLPDVTWYQDGLELPENGRFTVEKASDGTCSLRITNVVEDDDAEYTAKAINVNGDVTCTAELVVDIK